MCRILHNRVDWSVRNCLWITGRYQWMPAHAARQLMSLTEPRSISSGGITVLTPTAGAVFGGARGGRSGDVVDGLVPLAHQVIDDSGRAAILVGVNGGAVVGGGFADEHDWKFSRRLVSDEIGDAFLQHCDDTIHRLTLMQHGTQHDWTMLQMVSSQQRLRTRSTTSSPQSLLTTKEAPMQIFALLRIVQVPPCVSVQREIFNPADADCR